MSSKTGIRWTTSTWNPVTGCSKVSPGCAHCYAETLSLRMGWSPAPWTPENAAINVKLHPDRLSLPLRWPDPRRVFVNSMSDLFHELIPVDFVARVFAVMARADRHTFQVLTKRPERMAELLDTSELGAIEYRVGPVPDRFRDLSFRHLVAAHFREGTDAPRSRDSLGIPWPASFDLPWPLPNVWLGTSIENDRWTHRADAVRATPAAVRFLSLEPLLGPLPSLVLHGIDWIIVGGESGPGFRPMDHDWARDLRDRAAAAGVAFFFKQSSAIRTEMGVELDGERWEQYPDEEPFLSARRDKAARIAAALAEDPVETFVSIPPD